jgi:hypothetical protein
MRFRILGFPVHVHPFFFLVAALVGGMQNDLTLILVWVAIVFVSVLAHELGHALVARVHGQQPSIMLYAMGGLTSFQPLRRLTHGQSIAISLAGPGAGFLVGGLVWLASQSVPPGAPFVIHVAMHDLLWAPPHPSPRRGQRRSLRSSRSPAAPGRAPRAADLDRLRGHRVHRRVHLRPGVGCDDRRTDHL